VFNQFLKNNEGMYVFGFLSYDIKDDQTRHFIHHEKPKVPDLHFFAAENVLIKNNFGATFFGTEQKLVEIKRMLIKTSKQEEGVFNVSMKCNVNHNEYLKNISEIQNHIQLGDFYELNYCIEYTGEKPDIKSNILFNKLTSVTNAPFSSYYSCPEYTILSGSPERYLQKKKQTIISQPIKGTAKREQERYADIKIAERLKNDQKERSENMMIVDLVRNDLSKIAEKNSVNVPELCKLYSFKTVHQLISTISCQLKEGVCFTDIIDATFPMGSMTGAPKMNAIKFAHKFENFNRGIYSGSIGCIEPNGNFDFNVVIRSVVMDNIKNSLHVGIGGAITIKSNPDREYEECQVKYKAIKEILNA
jgi:para-aminobenzoate synthetase component 1